MITSSSSGYNRYLRRSAKYYRICGAEECGNLHFVSEVRPEVVRDISISRDQLELISLSKEES